MSRAFLSFGAIRLFMVATRPAVWPVVLMNARRRKKTKIWRSITSLISTALLMPSRLRAEAGPAVASASQPGSVHLRHLLGR